MFATLKMQHAQGLCLRNQRRCSGVLCLWLAESGSALAPAEHGGCAPGAVCGRSDLSVSAGEEWAGNGRE